jgi:Tat protein secretion system quality control protein TatD with DNase activity
MIPHTVRALAQVKDLPLEQVCAAIDATTTEVYGEW